MPNKALQRMIALPRFLGRLLTAERQIVGQTKKEARSTMKLDRVFVRVSSAQLKAVLVAIASRLEGFSSGDIDQLCADVAALESDDDVLIEPGISFQGTALPFVVDVFKDAQGSLEVVFLLPRALTSLVQDVARSVVGASAVRSIAAEPAAGPE